MTSTGSDGSQATARALWFPGRESVEIREEPLPPVGPTDVRVKALASGISLGTESLVFRGEVPSDLPLDLPAMQGSYTFPIKFGYASVGRVVEAGPEAGSAVGRLVFVHHPHQTEYVVPEASTVPIYRDLDPAVGTIVANMETAVNVLLDTSPRLGEVVVIYGQGTVGLLVALILDLTQMTAIVAVEPNTKHEGLGLDMGDINTLTSAEEAREMVMDLTDGRGADLAIECSGNPEALNAAIDCLASHGTLAVVSWYGTKPAALNLGGAFHRKRLRIVSSQVGQIDPVLRPRWDRERRLDVVREKLLELDLQPMVTHRIPFKNAETDYAAVLRNPRNVVHAVLTYGPDDV